MDDFLIPSSTRGTRRIQATPSNAGGGEGGSTAYGIFSSIFMFVMGAMAITAFGLSIHLMLRDKGNIRFIQGVPPINNEVFNLQGPGVSVAPNVPGNSITFSNTGVLSNLAGNGIAVSDATGNVIISNTGVLTVNGRSPTAGNILLSSTLPGIGLFNGAATNQIDIRNTGVVSNIAGTGISVSSATGDVTIANTGVVENLAGPGISLSATTGSVNITNTGVLSVTGASGISANTISGATTVTHDLTVQTALDDTDTMGPQVRYTGVVDGTGELGNWTAATLTIVDGGQGAVGSNAWQVPSVGLYDVRAHCTADNATDYQMIHAALTFGAFAVDPTVGGAYIAGRASTGVPALYDSFASIHVSGLVHAGCTGCPVAVGDALNLHVLVNGAESLMTCAIQVAKLI